MYQHVYISYIFRLLHLLRHFNDPVLVCPDISDLQVIEEEDQQNVNIYVDKEERDH